MSQAKPDALLLPLTLPTMQPEGGHGPAEGVGHQPGGLAAQRGPGARRARVCADGPVPRRARGAGIAGVGGERRRAQRLLRPEVEPARAGGLGGAHAQSAHHLPAPELACMVALPEFMAHRHAGKHASWENSSRDSSIRRPCKHSHHSAHHAGAAASQQHAPEPVSTSRTARRQVSTPSSQRCSLAQVPLPVRGQHVNHLEGAPHNLTTKLGLLRSLSAVR